MLKKLFTALFGGQPAAATEVTPTEYAGYLIYPEPMAEGASIGWQAASPRSWTACCRPIASSAPICLPIPPTRSASWCRRHTSSSTRWGSHVRAPQTYRQHRLMMSAALDELRQALARTGERRLIWLEGDEADCIARAEALLSGASYWLGTARANTTRNRRPRRCSGSVRSATRLCLILSAVFTPTHSGRWRAPCGQAVCCCC